MKIACIGDSITFGSGVRLTRFKDSYPAILGRLLGRDYKVYNFGNPGRTLSSSGDFPYIKEKEYRNSLAQMADAYIIMLGTNDSKPYNWNRYIFREEMPLFVSSYLSLNNNPRVYLCRPCKSFPFDKEVVPYDIQNDLIEGEITDIVTDTARDLGLPLIDLYTLTQNHSEWFMDGVHPNKRGNKEIAKEVKKCIIRTTAIQI